MLLQRFKIKNTLVPDTVDISVTKIWEDGENQDGARPTEVTVKAFG